MLQRRVFDRDYIHVLLLQIASAQTRGKDVSVACEEAGVTEATYFRWQREYGKADEVTRAVDPAYM